jgi:hypothetical protein
VEAAPAAPSPSPASQIAGSVVTLGYSGAQATVVRLRPDELGHVQITIARPPDGPASVTLVAERPEALLLLLRDQPHLNQALDKAGIPSDSRTLSFDLAPPRPEATAGAEASGDPAGGQTSGQPALDFGTPRDDGHRLERPSGPMAGPAGFGEGAAAPVGPAATAPAGMGRLAGLDITA